MTAAAVGTGWATRGIEHVLDDQTNFGVAGDFEFAVEEQRVGVFLAGEELQLGGEVGGEGEVRFAFDA